MSFFERKIPDYLTKRKNTTRQVLFTAVFALVFINLYSPFGVDKWYDANKTQTFLYSSLVILTGLLIIAISRIILYHSFRNKSMTNGSYIIWIAAEIISLSVVYLILQRVFISTEEELVTDFKSSLKVTALVLLLPYTISYLYFSWLENNNKLEELSEKRSNTGPVLPLMMPFHDEKGELRFSVKSEDLARIAQLVEHDLAKVGVAGPSPVSRSYFREAMENTSLKASLDAISQDAKNTLKAINGKLEGFGGDESVDDLTNYHYMMGMPYFDDPVELAEFGSFEEGLKIIKKNLENKAGGTLKVYEMVNEAKKVAVFGVGLMDPKVGEAHFLPIIGEDHLAALPYEIILVNNEASMLHGRFRFALYWPELTMGTFTKIMSTPGDVEETMEKLCK
jgi:hypothetical protein